MLLEGQKVAVTWHYLSRRHYELLGYKFTKYADTLIIPAEHLSYGSMIKVKVVCDYCGKIIPRIWKDYIKRNKKHITHKDSCKKCQNLKGKETSVKRYGSHYNQTEEGKERHLNTCIEKYGVDNVSKVQDVKNKKVKTFKKNYGKEYYFVTDEFKEIQNKKIGEWLKYRKTGKLDKEDVLHILDLRYKNKMTLREIEKYFNGKVKNNTIYYLCSGLTWKDITVPYLKENNII